MSAPESPRLLSCSPKYWLHHMGRERTLSAALQLQHDAGLILSNLQVLGQSPPSTGCTRRSCGWRLIGSHFRQKQCNLWRRLTVFEGRLTTWRPWTCGVHPVRRGFMAPCRRRLATRACPVQTAFRILVAVSDSCFCVFPWGKVRRVVDIVLYGYFATPPDL